MGRRLFGICLLLIALIFAGQLAQAGDRKSKDVQDSKMELFASSHQTHAVLVSGRSEQPDHATVRLFEASDPVLASKRVDGHEEKENSSETKHEHKALTLFHFDSRLGEVKVQPVFGKVTGAQFSLGF